MTTGGNPLLLRQLLTALEAEDVRPDAAHADVVRAIGSRAIASAVVLRLARLPEDAAAVARAVAVLGDGADLRRVAALAGTGEERTGTAAAVLSRAEILRPETPLAFVHPLVRDAVYRDIPAGERELRPRARRARAARGGRADRPGRRPPAQRAAARRGVDRRRAARGGQRRDAPRRGRERDRAPAARAGGAAAGGAAAGAAVRARRRRGAVERARGGRAPAGGLRHARGSGAAGRRRARARRAGSRSPASRPRAWPPPERAIADLPPGFDDARKQLDAFGLVIKWFGADADMRELRSRRGDPLPRRGGVRGVGDRLMALARRARLASTSTTPAEIAAELASRALDDGEVIAFDNGLFTSGAINCLAMTDRRGGDRGLRRLPRGRPPARLAVLDLLRAPVAGLHLPAPRRPESTPRPTCARPVSEFELYGYGANAMTYVGAFLALVRLEQGDLDGGWEALAMGAEAGGELSDAVRFHRNARLALLLADGRDTEALAAADALRVRQDGLGQPADAPLALGQGDRAVAARPPRGGAAAGAGGARARPAQGRAGHARADAADRAAS